MPQFRYIAHREGISEQGTVQAASKADAQKRLKAQGYAGIRLHRSAADTGGLFQRLFGR